MRALVLQHIACEPPGVFEDVLVDRGVELDRVELDEGDRLPEWRDFDLIVAMGGPMGAYQEADHPWLIAEKALIKAATDAGTPFWGSCLGSQVLASALGAEVYPGPEPEVGVLPVFLTAAAAEDPVFGPLPGPLSTLQWHGDTFELPVGAELLATSPQYRHQAFRVGRAYGVQFHVEVTASMAAQWAEVPAYREAAAAILGVSGLDRLLADLTAHLAPMQVAAQQLFGRWLDVAGCR